MGKDVSKKSRVLEREIYLGGSAQVPEGLDRIGTSADQNKQLSPIGRDVGCLWFLVMAKCVLGVPFAERKAHFRETVHNGNLRCFSKRIREGERATRRAWPGYVPR